MAVRTGSTSTSGSGDLPEVLTSPVLASIMVPLISEAAKLLTDQSREQNREESAKPLISGLLALGVQIDRFHTPAVTS